MNAPGNTEKTLEDLDAEIERLKELRHWLHDQKRREFGHSVPFGDLIADRWERAKSLGFGEGTSVFDSAIIIGDVKVGKNCFLSPNTYLEGMGGLTIGDNVTVGVGSMIATHTAVFKVLTGGSSDIVRKPVKIGNRVFIGPSSMIEMNVTIGDEVVVNAHSVIKQGKNIPSRSIVHGNPAKVIGRIAFTRDGEPNFMFNRDALSLFR